MGRELLAFGIHIQAAAQADPVQTIEEGFDLCFLAQRWDNDRQATCRHDGVEIAGTEAGVGAGHFAGSYKIGVDANEWTGCLSHHPPSVEPSAEWCLRRRTL